MLRDGEKNSFTFEEVYRELFPTIFRISYRITGDTGIAEDLCHEAFIKYYEREETFPSIDEVKYWLIRVVRNVSLNYEKRRARERIAFNKYKKSALTFDEGEEEKFLKEETKNYVQKALDKLPHSLRVVIVLKEYGGLSYREIGSIIGISEGNVKVRVFRAREKLAKIFEEEKIYVPRR